MKEEEEHGYLEGGEGGWSRRSACSASESKSDFKRTFNLFSPSPVVLLIYLFIRSIELFRLQTAHHKVGGLSWVTASQPFLQKTRQITPNWGKGKQWFFFSSPLLREYEKVMWTRTNLMRQGDEMKYYDAIDRRERKKKKGVTCATCAEMSPSGRINCIIGLISKAWKCSATSHRWLPTFS